MPAIDPVLAVVPIDPQVCPGFPTHFAISHDGVRALLANQTRNETRHAIERERCAGDKLILDARANAANARAEANDSWARWGPLGVVGAFIVGTAAGIAAAVAARGK